MKLTTVTCRDAVYHGGMKTITAADGTLELHQAGVLVQVKGRSKILTPWSNVLWVGVADDVAPAKAK